MTGTLPVPTIGVANATEDVDIRDCLNTINGLLTAANALDGAQIGAATIPAAALASNAVTTAKILDANVTTAKIADAAVTTLKLADANVTDIKLASPNNSVYRTLISGGVLATGATVANSPYIFCHGGSFAGGSFGITTGQIPYVFDFASGDFAVASLTTRFRIKLQVYVGTTSPSTVTFTAGLYPIATISAGGFVPGALVAGSTVASSGLATNSVNRFTGSDFAASALLTNPGLYAVGVAIGSITVPSTIGISVQLQTRNT